MLHPDGIGAQRGEPLGALQQIGQLAQRVFTALWRGVGHIGKGAEGCHIGKICVAEAAHIQLDRRAADGGLRRLFHAPGQAQGGGKIIGGAGGNIAQHRRLLAAQQAVDRLVQRPVAAGADHKVKRLRPPGGDIRQLAGPLGEVNGGLIARPHKGIQDRQEGAADGLLACVGIYQKQ